MSVDLPLTSNQNQSIPNSTLHLLRIFTRGSSVRADYQWFCESYTTEVDLTQSHLIFNYLLSSSSSSLPKWVIWNEGSLRHLLLFHIPSSRRDHVNRPIESHLHVAWIPDESPWEVVLNWILGAFILKRSCPVSIQSLLDLFAFPSDHSYPLASSAVHVQLFDFTESSLECFKKWKIQQEQSDSQIETQSENYTETQANTTIQDHEDSVDFSFEFPYQLPLDLRTLSRSFIDRHSKQPERNPSSSSVATIKSSRLTLPLVWNESKDKLPMQWEDYLAFNHHGIIMCDYINLEEIERFAEHNNISWHIYGKASNPSEEVEQTLWPLESSQAATFKKYVNVLQSKVKAFFAKT